MGRHTEWVTPRESGSKDIFGQVRFAGIGNRLGTRSRRRARARSG
ncbi:hypothetical protein [Wenjunlia tyrosinilytica]|nr:hypothetical protein [Wenjunlia tyrosinilytica]